MFNSVEITGGKRGVQVNKIGVRFGIIIKYDVFVFGGGNGLGHCTKNTVFKVFE